MSTRFPQIENRGTEWREIEKAYANENADDLGLQLMAEDRSWEIALAILKMTGSIKFCYFRPFMDGPMGPQAHDVITTLTSLSS